MISTSDVVIAGAGIVGAACGEALAREGLRVTLIEPAIAGGGATAAGMGHIVVMDDSEAQFALTHYSRDLWEALSPELPAEVEFERSGTLWVASDAEELAAVGPKQSYYTSRGVKAEPLDQKGLAAAEPNLRSGLAGGLLVPGDRVIYAPCAARWLVERTLARNGSLRFGISVSGLLSDGVQLSDGSAISAGLTICATGAWAPDLLPGLPVKPRKGHLAITDRYPGFVRHQVVELGYLKSAHSHTDESVSFNVQPRKTGQVLIGSSRQFGQIGVDVDRRILGRMLSRAVEFMPGLAALSVMRCWTGFRAATDDHLPLIGPYPGRENLYVATGHEGLGITTSLGTGQMLADMILHRTPAIDPAPYSPSRFPVEPARA
ncbi:MAG TPA: FAD-dependent oxidoreductase [Bryobacteraceae bacterium]|nr:FAD-dependent oxidoreductase [Bryobacteraceae bacterium]